jgi:hypothetical protein
MNKIEANEQRQIAHEIIHNLFEGKHTGQIQLLMMACHLSLKQLAPEDLKKTAENLIQILP